MFLTKKTVFLGLTVIGMTSWAIAHVGLQETFNSLAPMTYETSASTLQGRTDVDPKKAITVKPIGWHARFTNVELIDGTGKVLFSANNQTSLSLPATLEFDTRYTLKTTTEQLWPGQPETREISFSTATVPKLEGPVPTTLGVDASIPLHFDRSVSALQATGDLTLKTEADADGQTIRLLASNYEQNRNYEIQLNYKTATGVPVPPINLTLHTPPALVAQTNIQGLSNLGLMLPLQITFSEPLYNRTQAMKAIQVQTRDGKAVSGKWSWIGQRQLKFTPAPTWPASSTINVKLDEKNLKSEQGGMLAQPMTAQFNTGTDRRLFVYLDKQQVEAVENGKVIRTFKVSTGKQKTPTVTGTFYIYDRYRRKTMRSDVGPGEHGYYEVKDVPYTQFFHRDYAFHGAFWHNSFGRPASHGCVNLATKEQNKRWPNAAEDAGWLYRWGALGLPVTVMQKSPEPLQANLSPTKAIKSLNK